MHDYDTALKAVLLGPARQTLLEITGLEIRDWKNVELPDVQNPRADMLGETETGALVHIELQSTNDASMPIRMALYGLRIYLRHGRFPRQVVLYVGEAPIRMAASLSLPGLTYEYKLLDIRELDGDRLLESEWIGDNIIAILACLSDQRAAVRRILTKIAGLEYAAREVAFAELFLLAGLRKSEDVVERERKDVPILTDIRDHKIIGREYKRGEITILRRQIEDRFGPLPDWAEENLQNRTWRDLEDLSVRVYRSETIDDLLR